MGIDRRLIDSLLATPYGEAAYTVVAKLTDAGYDTWWVGGATRDLALGKIPTDIDIATAATPDQILRIFKDVKEDVRNLASMRVKQGKFVFELTTFREESDASGNARHPESIVFTTCENDAKRRDFTMNAIYYHPISREIFDPANGLGDVSEKLVRFIGEPSARIKHDALRILRAVRLRALIDGQYHPDTYKALHKESKLVSTLSGSRVLEELEKMLTGPNPARALEDLWELDVLEQILPELNACKGIAQPADYHHEGDVWEHLLACTKAFRPEDDVDVRLAALFHDIGKVETFSLTHSAGSGQDPRIRFDHHASVSADLASKILKRWQTPTKRIEKIDWLIRHHMTMGTFTDLSDERKAHWYFHPWFADLLRLFWLDIAGTDPSDFRLYNAIVSDYNGFLDSHPRPPKPLLSGDEVMEILGIRPGEEVGKVLQGLHDAQVRKDITTRVEAKKFLLDRFPRK